MHRSVIYLSIILLFSFQISFGQVNGDFFGKTTELLNDNVENGLVNYKAIKADSSKIDALLELAKNSSVSKSDVQNYQAFWINVYNLLVIKAIANNYPLSSPLDVSGFFDKIKYEVGGQKVTLNEIENDLLRANFPTEARFHFVLVCAGLGCPPIINTAYTPETLEEQLQKQTVLALNNPDFIRIKGKKVLLSQLFEWYKKDFTQNGTEIDFVNQFREAKIDANKIGYYPYDWTLNELKN